MKHTIPPLTFKGTLTPGTAVAGETRRVKVADLHVLANLNLRVDETENLDELMASIAANGFYDDKPLAGYVTADDTVIVIDGHRRLAACQRLNAESLEGDVVDTVPVVLKPEDVSIADLTVAMIQSASGKELTMFEKGIGVRRLMTDSGLSKPEIARRLGVTEKSIDNYLLVASAPARARNLLLDGKVTSTQVLRAKGDTAKLEKMVKKATDEGRTRARPNDAEPKTPTVGPNDGALPPESLRVNEIGNLTAEHAALIGTPLPALTIHDAVDRPVIGEPIVKVAIVKDADMAAVMRQVAAAIRERVPHDKGDADTAHVNGTITIGLTLDQPEKPKRTRKAKPVTEPIPDLLAHAIPADEVEL